MSYKAHLATSHTDKDIVFRLEQKRYTWPSKLIVLAQIWPPLSGLGMSHSFTMFTWLTSKIMDFLNLLILNLEENFAQAHFSNSLVVLFA